MDLPFSGFELTFITVAFFVFSLYSLASIYIQPSAADSGKHCSSLWHKHTHTDFLVSELRICLQMLTLGPRSPQRSPKSTEPSPKRLNGDPDVRVGRVRICRPERIKTAGFSEENHNMKHMSLGLLWISGGVWGKCCSTGGGKKSITIMDAELCAEKPQSLGEDLTNPVTFGPWRPFGVTSRGWRC